MVSVLFNEPKLLKFSERTVLQAEIRVSVLFNEPKLLKSCRDCGWSLRRAVSVLFNEPKLLKFGQAADAQRGAFGFSALQRAEIAEIVIDIRSFLLF